MSNPTSEQQLVDIDFEELLADINRFNALKALRNDHSYVADLIKILYPRPNGLRRHIVLNDLERQRRADGLPIPEKFEQAVQSSYNQYSIDSMVFQKRGLPDSAALFYSPEGKGSGRWAVYKDRAAAWLKIELSKA